MRSGYIQRKTALKADPAKVAAWKRRTAVRLKPGKKVKAWDKERRSLKEEFAAAGITTCEVRRAGCWRDNALTFAHSLKRRNIVGAQIREVCLACMPCHDILELLPEAEMSKEVRRIIAARPAA